MPVAIRDDPPSLRPQYGQTPLDYRYPRDDMKDLFEHFGSLVSTVNLSCSDDTMSPVMAKWLLAALLKNRMNKKGAFEKLGVRRHANPNLALAQLTLAPFSDLPVRLAPLLVHVGRGREGGVQLALCERQEGLEHECPPRA